MDPTPFPDIDSTPLEGGGRRYQVRPGWEVVAHPIPTPLPHAPDGSIVFVFVRGAKIVGDWNWTADPEGVAAVIRAFRDGTSPDYTPPRHRAPGGEEPMIRPPIQDLVKNAWEAVRPDAEQRAEARKPWGYTLNISLDPDEDPEIT